MLAKLIVLKWAKDVVAYDSYHCKQRARITDGHTISGAKTGGYSSEGLCWKYVEF